MDEQRIDPATLTEFGVDVLTCLGVPRQDAELFAQSLAQADAWGHSSHGMMRLPWYVRRLRSGAMKAVTAACTVVDAGAVAVLDGRHGIGQVLAKQAADEAIRRAKQYGIGAVGVRQSNHFGTAMYFSLMGPPQGCILLVTTNASPAMAPWGGREKRVGTNPWSLAAPAGRHAPMVMDLANTAVARGKIYLAEKKGVPIPQGWALDGTGKATTDPAQAVLGLIAPMAGHKGYVIAVMMDVLSGVLTGSTFGAAVTGPYQSEKPSGCGHFVLALDIATFMNPVEFATRMELLIEELKATPLAEGSAEILYPGELEARHAQEAANEGLALPQRVLAELTALGHELGVPGPGDRTPPAPRR